MARLNPPPRRARFDLRGCMDVTARARTGPGEHARGPQVPRRQRCETAARHQAAGTHCTRGSARAGAYPARLVADTDASSACESQAASIRRSAVHCASDTVRARGNAWPARRHCARRNAAALRSGTRVAPGAEQHERLRAPSSALLRRSCDLPYISHLIPRR